MSSSIHDVKDDVNLCISHVTANAHKTKAEPAGMLPFPWLLPSGFYRQLWDWDAVWSVA